MKSLLSLFMIVTVASANSPLDAQRYNRASFDFQGYSAFIYFPEKPAEGKPWIWVMPAWLVDTKDPAINNTGIMDYYINAALAKGIAVAGVEIGVTFGSPKAAAFNHTFYKYLRETFEFNRKPRLLLQSNGALSGYRWANEHLALVNRIVGIFPVLNLISWPERKFLRGPNNLINPAWAFMPKKLDLDYLGDNSPYEYMKYLMRLNIPTLYITGTLDDVAPLAENGRIAKSLYPDIKLINVPYLGHQIAPEFHQNAEVAKFLTGGL